MGIFVWKMSGISDKLSSEDKAKIEEEKDLLENQSGKAIDNVNPIDIKNLYLSGKRKNVVTINYKSPKDVYNQAKSARAEETLTKNILRMRHCGHTTLTVQIIVRCMYILIQTEIVIVNIQFQLKIRKFQILQEH